MTLRHSPSSFVARPLVALAALAALAGMSLCPERAAAQSVPQYAGPGYVAPFAQGFFGRRHRHVPVVVYTQSAPQQPVYVPVVAPCTLPARRVAPVVAPVVTPPADENGYLVLATTPLVVGQLVRASWGASYFSAQVTSVLADGTVGIHYVGYSDMWDETVPRTHLRLPR